MSEATKKTVRAVRPRAKSSATSAVSRPTGTKQPVDPWDGALDAGDKIEFSITAEVKNRQGRSFWVKGGSTITVRPGESPEQAKARQSAFVIDYVETTISEYVG